VSPVVIVPSKSKSARFTACGRDPTLQPAEKSWPSRSGFGALRAGAVNARRPRGTRGRSAAERIDRAEHSVTISRGMAGVQTSPQPAQVSRRLTAQLRRRIGAQIAWGLRDRTASRGWQSSVHVTRHARDKRRASRDVNDPPFQRQGPPCLAMTGVVHITACSMDN
jgi:hypothetical protein